MRADCVCQAVFERFIRINFVNTQNSPEGVIDARYPQVVQKREKKEEMEETQKEDDKAVEKRRNQNENRISYTN